MFPIKYIGKANIHQLLIITNLDYKDKIALDKLPAHIAIIMDGNGRWAKQKLRNRIFGHTNGVQAVRSATETCAELGVSYLTLYAFSTENWGRPASEVSALMNLLLRTIRQEAKQLHKNNIRLNAIGDISKLPGNCYQELLDAMELTKNNTRMTLTLALNYSARWEITEAVKTIAQEVKNGETLLSDINEQLISHRLTTKGMPDPELLIRTSGEHRISNYLLWQIAYAELYFTDIFWPEFNKEELYKAILDFQQRERRFGKLVEG